MTRVVEIAGNLSTEQLWLRIRPHVRVAGLRAKLDYAIREGAKQGLILFGERTSVGITVQGYSRGAGFGERWILIVELSGPRGTRVSVRRTMSWEGRFWGINALAEGGIVVGALLWGVPLENVSSLMLFGLVAFFNYTRVAFKGRGLRDPVGKFVAEVLACHDPEDRQAPWN